MGQRLDMGFPSGGAGAGRVGRSLPGIAMLLLLGFAARQGAAAGLSIALTNDDGWAAPGVQVIYEALTNAGHRVLLAAPGANQSGASAALNTATLQLRRESESQYSVWTCRDGGCADPAAGSPATSALLAIDLVRQRTGAAPDLLISGINEGPNLGIATTISGTVGAATVAAAGSFGGAVPAIAISTALPRGCANSEPCARAQFEEAARLVLRVVAGLESRRLASRQARLLPVGLVLNLNVPPGVPRGLRLSSGSDRFYARGAYTLWRMSCIECAQLGIGQTRVTGMQLSPDPVTSPAGDADADRFAAGWATVTLLGVGKPPPAPRSWRWLEKLAP